LFSPKKNGPRDSKRKQRHERTVGEEKNREGGDTHRTRGNWHEHGAFKGGKDSCSLRIILSRTTGTTSGTYKKKEGGGRRKSQTLAYPYIKPLSIPLGRKNKGEGVYA